MPPAFCLLTEVTRTMKKGLSILIAVLTLGVAAIHGQPANDVCQNAIFLSDLDGFCSGTGAFTNAGASASPEPLPGCFPADGPVDVWFAFVADATNVNISVIGNSGLNGGGTLQNPQLALYSGACGSLVEEECISDAFNNDLVETFGGPLEIGQTYYIRVSARAGQTGTFRLCINSFNAVPEPSGDCPTGVVLCDKSAFTVENVTGVGLNGDEITGNTCDLPFGCSPTEISSSWYRWTCDQPGTLTFSITPTNPADDIDFVLYELPNGVSDCSDKEVLRCMFSGEQVGAPLPEWEPCTGATGLSLDDPDVFESCGCQVGDNNFAQAITMEEGRAYALFISNFSNSGSGFTISFGGTGTFLGPFANLEADSDSVCYGEEISFSDGSFFPGGIITSRSWYFGPGSSQQTKTGGGPHAISWSEPGVKNVVLTVETGQGCVVTDIRQVFIDSCCTTVNAISGSGFAPDLDCWYDSDGAIDFEAVSNAEPHTFSWSTGAVTEDVSGLQPGVYSVTVTNEATCTEVFEVEVSAPDAIVPLFDIVMPTCDGGQDGALSVQASGGTPPWLYSLNGGSLSSTAQIVNIPVGTYTVSIQDANGCILDTFVEVNELELELDSLVDVITPPSCFGFSDGSIILAMGNGLPPYLYDLNDGNGFTPNNALLNIPSGTYPIEVTDANNCEGTFLLEVNDPPPLTLDFDTLNVTCSGLADGALSALPGGGTPGYTLLWSTGGSGTGIGPLDTGLYSVTVTDANDCIISGEAPISEPPQLIIDSILVTDVICHGDTNGSVQIFASGGTPPYVYSLGGGVVLLENLIEGLGGGGYTVVVEDANGCLATMQVVISEPPPLSIDAGPDLTIELGETVTLQSVLSPIFWSVNYQWEGPEGTLSCSSCPRPTVQPLDYSVYTVTVRDSNGCEATDQLQVRVDKVRPVFIPNVFSPNEDGRNDFFSVFGGAAAERVELLQVYSRWGELVYEGRDLPLNDPTRGWNGTFRGKPVDAGVFAFYTEVLFIDGEVILFEGDVTVVR
ncbi:MAG: gliding motility-associated C-terminal domain-containing protein [Saprospiraceae bacterium]